MLYRRRRWGRLRKRRGVDVSARSIRTNRSRAETQVFAIHGVFSARVFAQTLARLARFPTPGVGEGLGVKLRIFDGRVHVDVLRVGPCPALDHVQRVAMRTAVLVG